MKIVIIIAWLQETCTSACILDLGKIKKNPGKVKEQCQQF